MDEQFLLPDTTWPFTGPRLSDPETAVYEMARRHFDDYTYGVVRGLQPFCSDAVERWSTTTASTRARPCAAYCRGARALHTGDSRPLEAGSGNLPPPVAGATEAGHACVPRGSALAGPSYPIASRPVAVSDRASPGAPQRRRPPKLGSRARRALQEQQVAEPVRLFGEEVGAEGVPPSAGPSSGSSEGRLGPRSVATGFTTRGFAGLAPPKTTRSVTAGVASLATTRCVSATWMPSSGARMPTWRRS